MKRSSAGFSLIEVVVALAILGIAGLALVEATAQGLRTAGASYQRERLIADEDRLLSAYSALTRTELEARIGWHVVGRYGLTIERRGLSLFDVTVGPQGAPPDLATVLYRPEMSEAR